MDRIRSDTDIRELLMVEAAIEIFTPELPPLDKSQVKELIIKEPAPQHLIKNSFK